MPAGYSYKPPELLLEELGVVEPEDIDIEAIAEYCGATIVYESLEGCDARIVGYGERAIITVNHTLRRERQRFSGAHELGHWMCDRGNIAFSCTAKMFNEDWFQNSKESRANRYAADTLLPKPIFRQRSKKREMTFFTVKALAEDFQTSLTSTAIRLVELGSYPAMVVCSKAGHRRWFTRGSDVSEKIWPCDSIERGSVAFDILNGHLGDEGPVDVYANVWINLPDADQYEIREHSMKITPDLILSLLWWKDESQLLDLENL